ncbi:MAG: tRNA (adenosine(37)-N6)-threonylcarbamoyltransferase complex dimerization subunit type 1 TsaB [Christensenellaceae bacterium]|jgi:tRNA threonylcarbamoyl adenosine modification protein YeaZ|nr:tRNA (adenosine(37)-N6)-threonylcarbamoyltransferase complex dimerization subunit type 1 TsaB [Christensenellaceae bacterium]
MNALIVDCTSPKLSVLVLKNEILFSHVGTDSPKRHASQVLPVIDDLLTKANIQTSDLNVICAISGPGSFTGIRIGAATCNALAFAVGAKRVSLTSLEPILVDKDYGLALLSCNNNSYYALLKKENSLEYFAMDLNELEKRDEPKYYVTGFDIEKTIIAFEKKCLKNDYVDLITPFYIKKSSAEKHD